MARTNSIWVLAIHNDILKKDLFKVLEFNSLREMAYCLNCEIYDVSNFYHKISKPKGQFRFITIFKSY
jgi:hypothetical protein